MSSARRLLLPALALGASASPGIAQTLYGNLSVSDTPVVIASEGYANTVAVANPSSSAPASLTVTAAFTNQLPGGAQIASSANTYGAVLVSGSSASWTDTGGLIIGGVGTGTFALADGASATAAYASLGDSRTFTVPTRRGTGTLSLSDGANLVLAGTFYVGNQGSGTLTLASGSTVSSGTAAIARNGGSSGSATLSGAGTAWTVSGDLTVGQSGSATLRVESGAILSSVNARIGQNAGVSAAATITGAGSRWTNAGALIVGNNADNISRLDILDGARVDAATVTVNGDDTLFVGAGSALHGAVTVNTSGSLAGGGEIVGDVQLTGGALAPDDGSGLGTLSIDGSLTVGTGSSLVFQLDSGGASDRVTTTGALNAGGSLVLSTRDGASFVGGEIFQLFEFTSFGGSFAEILLPELGVSGLNWDTSRLGLDGTLLITAVPEPATVPAFIGLAAAGFVAMRRRIH